MSMYATRVMVEPMGDVHRPLACCSRLPSLFCWLIGQKGACFSATRSPHMWRNLHRSLKLLTLLELNKAHTSEAKVHSSFTSSENFLSNAATTTVYAFVHLICYRFRCRSSDRGRTAEARALSDPTAVFLILALSADTRSLVSVSPGRCSPTQHSKPPYTL